MSLPVVTKVYNIGFQQILIDKINKGFKVKINLKTTSF